MKLRLQLLGRYGIHACSLFNNAYSSELETIGMGLTTWAELRWAARAEGVVHLDDLLLQRVRLGITMPHGELDYMEHIHDTVGSELGWDEIRWSQEVT